jgi:hypothetical protein
MHYIFKVNELLGLIVFQLSDDGQTLVQLAQTCKLFMAAALPVIWRELPSIAPLLKLLPNDAVSVQRVAQSIFWDIVSALVTPVER